MAITTKKKSVPVSGDKGSVMVRVRIMALAEGGGACIPPANKVSARSARPTVPARALRSALQRTRKPWDECEHDCFVLGPAPLLAHR